MSANRPGTQTHQLPDQEMIELGRSCGVDTYDDVALLVGREQSGCLSDEDRQELQRLRRLEVI
ncbi:MAG: hypothetical protein K2W95_20075 [Candidatus Obscuribacterales bacterium]|nr:hypothetical protein [Candidatus Obscuribacterales bacterium]